jgi:IS5 family transposase
MTQRTFAELAYEAKKRKTRREVFLERMDALIPWPRLEKRIARHYPKGGVGRRPYPLGVMLRVHCLQLFYNLSDPAMEDALYEVESMRRFAGVSLDRVPDETTILNFRHLLERHTLGKVLFDEIKAYLSERGLILREGTILDATILSAPSSTKNEKGERDQEMRFRCDYAAGVPADFWESVRPELDKARPGVVMLAESDEPAFLRKASPSVSRPKRSTGASSRISPKAAPSTPSNPTAPALSRRATCSPSSRSARRANARARRRASSAPRKLPRVRRCRRSSRGAPRTASTTSARASASISRAIRSTPSSPTPRAAR